MKPDAVTPSPAGVLTEAAAVPKSPIRHFYSLDVLRGLAAIGIIFFHWKHFFYHGTTPGPYVAAAQPFYGICKILYTNGWRGVDLFFCLSGFIFYWLYSEQISERKVPVREFAILRFSRLYPLHFVTLIFVAVGQFLVFRNFGHFFVYPSNDPLHFVLHLLFAFDWGYEVPGSFNEPAWSVSVEVFLYVVFFSTACHQMRRWWQLLLLIGVGDCLKYVGFMDLGLGFISFFAGGLTYKIFLHEWRRGFSGSYIRNLLVVMAVLWILLPLNIQYLYLDKIYRSSSWHGRLVLHHWDVIAHFIDAATFWSFELILFPGTIFTLAACESYRGSLGKRFAFLGNMSYSIYLLHFPLQLVFGGVALALALPQAVFYSRGAMLLFFALLLPLSLASYYRLERPCQSWIRKRLLPKKRGRLDDGQSLSHPGTVPARTSGLDLSPRA